MIVLDSNLISEVAEKLRLIEVEISQERGHFVFFALIEREDAPGKWDVLISAEWVGENKKEVLNYIASKVSSKFTWQEQVLLSKIVVLEPSDSFVATMNGMFDIEHANLRFKDCTFNGVSIKDAFIITSKRLTSTTENDSLGKKKVGRNEACPCGSGKKYKKCCGK